MKWEPYHGNLTGSVRLESEDGCLCPRLYQGARILLLPVFRGLCPSVVPRFGVLELLCLFPSVGPRFILPELVDVW